MLAKYSFKQTNKQQNKQTNKKQQQQQKHQSYKQIRAQQNVESKKIITKARLARPLINETVACPLDFRKDLTQTPVVRQSEQRETCNNRFVKKKLNTKMKIHSSSRNK